MIQTRHDPFRILGVDFDLLDYPQVIQQIEQWRKAGRRSFVAVANPYSVSLCRRDGEMARAVDQSGMTLPDGVGVVMAAKMLGYPNHGRVTGPTLMLRLCDEGRKHGYRHYFYGGRPGVAASLAERLTLQFPGLEVAGHYCPPFGQISELQDIAIVDQINAARPDVLWVGLGAPKQEKWMLQHVGRIHATAMIGVGAAFDFHSGNVKWAPSWIRRIGMEWAYRLMLEPGRMWRRNLESPRFLAAVAVQRLTSRSSRLAQ